MKRKVSSLQSTKRRQTSDESTLRQSSDESGSLAKKFQQTSKKFSFVWLAKNVGQSKRIEGYLKRLEALLPCALSTDSYDECKQWLLKYHGDQNLLVIVSNKMAEPMVSDVHSLPSIVGIYIYSTDLKTRFEWAEEYAKVRRVLPSVSRIVERLSTDLEILEAIPNANVENVYKGEASDDAEGCDAREIKGNMQENSEGALTMFHFVIVDIVKRLNQRATAMLRALITMTQGAICVIDDGATIDMDELSDKPTFLCVSSSFAAIIKNRPEQIKATFILEEDKHKVDHRERFENGEDLIFELADEIYRCYKKEAAAYVTSGDLITAQRKEEQGNRVHRHLKEAFKSASSTTTACCKTMQTVDDIIFDGTLYESATHSTLLLYQRDGVAVAVPLPNANLMSFVRIFDNTTQCEQHVETNLQKLITLFTIDQSVQQWLAEVSSIPDNLQHIKIFCERSDRLFIDGWSKRYMNRFRNLTFEVVDHERLNYRLLLFGVDHLKNMEPDFEVNSPLHRRLRLNYRRVCHALANYFWSEAI